MSRDFGKIATAKQAGIELENRCEAEKLGIATSPEQGADLMASATCLYRYKKKISTSIQKERCIINCLISSTFARFRSNIFITMSISPTLQSDYSPSDESSQRKQWSCLILIASTRICLIPPLDKINWRQTEQRQEIDISHPATCLRQTVKWQEIDINPNPTPQHA